jgi:tRNA(Ile)-lysidine synthase
LEKEFQAHIESKKLFNSENRILVALSGGIDSVVLCHLLKRLNYNFSVAHCNFQLRDIDSEKDEFFCENLATELGLKFHNIRFETKKHAAENKLSIQMAARELRYKWFKELRVQNEYDYVVTAHHMNDQVETLLLNLVRGTGLKGITGIPEKKNHVIRPLLIFTRSEIETYAKNNSLVFREDNSNSDEKYARNILRKKVIPIIKEINPSLEKTIFNNLKNFKEAYFVSQDYLNEKFEVFNLKLDQDENRLSIVQLKKEGHLNFFLHGILSKFGFNTSQIENAAELLDSISGKEIHSTDYFILKDRENLIIKRKERGEFKEVIIDHLPIKLEIPNCEFTTQNINEIDLAKVLNVVYFDAEKIELPLKIRRWKSGDKFYPTGMQGSKKLSDYFVGIKASKIEKNSALILECGGEIMWIMGKRIDRRFSITEQTKKVLSVKFSLTD